MSHDTFRRGLADLGNGLYAWLQPDGGWGWSNAGLVVDGDQSLLVDTLFDEPLTAAMLGAMRSATGIAAEDIGILVNTHANGDHTHGNALVPNAEIVATTAAALEMAELPPAKVAALMAGARGGQLGPAGEMLVEVFAPFDLASATGKAPTRTFEDQLVLFVGDKEVRLKKLGPAHTAGDLVVHVPGDRAVFTGDILFNGVTPIMWAGPVGNWLDACDWIMDLGAEPSSRVTARWPTGRQSAGWPGTCAMWTARHGSATTPACQPRRPASTSHWASSGTGRMPSGSLPTSSPCIASTRAIPAPRTSSASSPRWPRPGASCGAEAGRATRHIGSRGSMIRTREAAGRGTWHGSEQTW